MKKQVMISVIVFIVFSIAGLSFGADFGRKSATLTNRYFPLKVNDWGYSSGFGTWAGHTWYLHAVGTEVVDTVKCLKVNMIQIGTDDFLTLWFAQDKKGNIWVLKVYSHNDDETFLLDEHFHSWFMPAEPEVGDPAAITIPEDEDNYCEIVQTDVSSICTPLDCFDDCLKVYCFHNGDPVEVEYYAPRFGSVRYYFIVEPLDRMDIAEFHTDDDDDD